MGYRDRLSIKRYYKYKDEVIERNILASQTFIIVGSIIAIVYMFANIFVVRTDARLFSPIYSVNAPSFIG